MPSAYNKKAELREIEPYVYCQFTHSKYSPRHGASRLPWLSGSASWAYYTATQYILGIQPDYAGLRIDPCIPAEWKGFKASRSFRGKMFHITVKNEKGVQKGVRKIHVNGKEIEGNLILTQHMENVNEVTVSMG